MKQKKAKNKKKVITPGQLVKPQKSQFARGANAGNTNTPKVSGPTRATNQAFRPQHKG